MGHEGRVSAKRRCKESDRRGNDRRGIRENYGGRNMMGRRRGNDGSGSKD